MPEAHDICLAVRPMRIVNDETDKRKCMPRREYPTNHEHLHCGFIQKFAGSHFRLSPHEWYDG
jgi:hypothetical protein